MSVTKRVCVALTEAYREPMARLVRDGVYVSRSELIKDALRRLFRHYGMKPFAEAEG